jgi:hypothetical protein
MELYGNESHRGRDENNNEVNADVYNSEREREVGGGEREGVGG